MFNETIYGLARVIAQLEARIVVWEMIDAEKYAEDIRFLKQQIDALNGLKKNMQLNKQLVEGFK